MDRETMEQHARALRLGEEAAEKEANRCASTSIWPIMHTVQLTLDYMAHGYEELARRGGRG